MFRVVAIWNHCLVTRSKLKLIIEKRANLVAFVAHLRAEQPSLTLRDNKHVLEQDLLSATVPVLVNTMHIQQYVPHRLDFAAHAVANSNMTIVIHARV